MRNEVIHENVEYTDYTRSFFFYFFFIFHVLIAIMWFATGMVAYTSITL